MIEKEVIILNRAGIHTRPAASIIKVASKYKSEFFIIKDGMEINGKSIIGVMTLAAEQGTKLLLRFIGIDENDAANDMLTLFNSAFDEPK